MDKYSDNFRAMDPARGAFDPQLREPITTAVNPRGTRHVDKTKQDSLPKEKRSRVAEAQKRIK